MQFTLQQVNLKSEDFIHLDANNLYKWNIWRYLPIHKAKWLNDEGIEIFDIH